MSQPALIDTIIQDLGLEETSTQHQTPALSPSLYKYGDKETFNEAWSYRSIIRVLT